MRPEVKTLRTNLSRKEEALTVQRPQLAVSAFLEEELATSTGGKARVDSKHRDKWEGNRHSSGWITLCRLGAEKEEVKEH